MRNGGHVTNATANSTSFLIRPAGDGSDEELLTKAQKLPAGTLVYDIQATWGSYPPYTFMAGNFTVTGDVSR